MENITLPKVLLLIAAAMVGGFIARYLIIQYEIRTAQQQVNNAVLSFQKQIERSAEASRQQQLAIEKERTRQKELEIAAKQEQLQAQQEIAQLKTAKEAAWDKFYKRPPKCESPPTNEAMVNCGNYHIRERQKFELAWAKEHQL